MGRLIAASFLTPLLLAILLTGPFAFSEFIQTGRDLLDALTAQFARLSLSLLTISVLVSMPVSIFCRWAGLQPIAFELPPAGPEFAVADAAQEALARALEAACFVGRHDRAMRALAGLTRERRAAGFDRLRRDYPTRRDFHAWRVRCSHPETAQLLKNIAFSVSSGN